jgi:hypothetical protein
MGRTREEETFEIALQMQVMTVLQVLARKRSTICVILKQGGLAQELTKGTKMFSGFPSSSSGPYPNIKSQMAFVNLAKQEPRENRQNEPPY